LFYRDSSADIVYAIVHNIPSTYHSRDLRTFFNSFVEAQRFVTFHFLHRPEQKQIESQSSSDVLPEDDKKKQQRTFCCPIRLTRRNRHKLIKQYHGSFWTNEANKKIPLRCIIIAVKETTELLALRELHAPAIIPAGNVGTNMAFLNNMIQQCRLPASAYRKFGIDLASRSTHKQRQYSKVPHKYDTRKQRSITKEKNINDTENNVCRQCRLFSK
jgi:hypothetical protein